MAYVSADIDLDDPIVRLQVIVELRRLGYTVESTVRGQ